MIFLYSFPDHSHAYRHTHITHYSKYKCRLILNSFFFLWLVNLIIYFKILFLYIQEKNKWFATHMFFWFLQLDKYNFIYWRSRRSANFLFKSFIMGAIFVCVWLMHNGFPVDTDNGCRSNFTFTLHKVFFFTTFTLFQEKKEVYKYRFICKFLWLQFIIKEIIVNM